MILCEYGEYTPSCDACGIELEPYDDFQDAVNGIKANGWATKNEGGEWLNYCPDCAASNMWEE